MRPRQLAIVTSAGPHPLRLGAMVRIETIDRQNVARVCVMNHAVAHVPVSCLTGYSAPLLPPTRREVRLWTILIPYWYSARRERIARRVCRGPIERFW